ncbi:MAG: hypothetical protein NTX05_02310 [Fusobacteria bacterium]|nr:hypothetical protein [Fusobacteriota bacterium]
MKDIIFGLDAIIMIASIVVFIMILLKLRVFKYTISIGRMCLFGVIGIVAMFCDTIGIGSFATSMAMIKATKSMSDDDMPGYLNLMQILPNGLEAVLFLTVVTVDLKTFFALVIACIIGGYVSGRLVEFLPIQKIRIAMIIALILVAILLLLTLFNIVPNDGMASGLIGWKLIVGVICFFFIGALPAIGVGGYAAMQVILFLLGINPLVVFPIMTTSGSLQQVATTISFLKHKKLLVKEAITAGLVGCVGVIVAFFMIKMFTGSDLHWLLVIVIVFNIYMISKSFLRSKRDKLLFKQ